MSTTGSSPRPAQPLSAAAEKLASTSWPQATFFGSLPPNLRSALAQIGVPCGYDNGEPLMAEGESAQSVCVIIRGHAKVLANDGAGRDHLLGLRGRGDLVGELALLTGRPRSASVIARGRLNGLIVDELQFRRFLLANAYASVVLAALLASRLRASDDHHIDAMSRDVSTRVALAIHDLTVRIGVEGASGTEINVSQAELAQLAGTAEVTVHRVLRDLRAGGVIRSGYRKLTVRDTEQLARAAALPPDSISRWNVPLTGGQGWSRMSARTASENP